MNLTGWDLRADGVIELRTNSPYKWKRKPTLAVYGAGRNRKYRIGE